MYGWMKLNKKHWNNSICIATFKKIYLRENKAFTSDLDSLYLCVNSNLKVGRADNGRDFTKLSASDAQHWNHALIALFSPAAAPTEGKKKIKSLRVFWC